MAKRMTDPSLEGQLDMFGEFTPTIAKPASQKIKPITPPAIEAANTNMVVDLVIADTPTPANDLTGFEEVGRRRPGRPSLNKRPIIHHGRALGELDARALLRAPELSELLGLTLSTLAKLRCSGKGPPFYKLTNQTVGYRQEDVMDWLSGRRRESTWKSNGR